MSHNTTRILFVLKQRVEPSYTVSSGLFNSAKFLVEMLNQTGTNAKLVEVVDNNSIDHEVRVYNPTHVIIEALWVVPEKFDILRKIYPTTIWIIRIHSNIPFISHEGIAIDWILKYVKMSKVYVADNDSHTTDWLKSIVKKNYAGYERKVLYLPNYYPVGNDDDWIDFSDTIEIGCFGAIRQLKNQLIQAMAAIEYAKRNNLKLYFHINSTRTDTEGQAILKNIRNLFSGMPRDQYTLVEHGWLSHLQFIELMKTMNVSMQVSFSESFNIVSADAVSHGIPVVVSKEIFWADPKYYADPTSVDDITDTIKVAIRAKRRQGWFFRRDTNRNRLAEYSEESKDIWRSTFKSHMHGD